MKASGRKTYLVVLVGFLGMASPGRAQEWIRFDPSWIHLEPLDWDLTSKTDASREKIGEDTTSRDIEMQSGLRVKQSAYVLDPRIATFSVEINPVFSQGMFRSSTPGLDEDRDTLFLNFNVNTSVFRGVDTPLAFNAQASRNSGSFGTSLGARSDFTTDNRRVALDWKNKFFPTTLSYTERLTEQTFRAGLSGVTFNTRDDALRAIKIKGRSSKMEAEVEHAWFEDQVEDRNNDYTEDSAFVSHDFRWGKGSYLRSRADVNDRRGFRSFQRLTLSENGYIQHTKNLASRLSYRFASFDQEDRKTTANTGNYALTHNLYNNLTTTLTLKAENEDLAEATEDEYRARLDLVYRKKIPWDGRLSAGLGGGYGITDRVSAGGLIDTRDESQNVDATLLVLLDQRFIDTSTIIVTDITGIIIFTEGVDYNVVSQAGGRTQLQIIPGFGINPGDTILVSYKFESLPSVEFSMIPFTVFAELDFGWVRVFHRTVGETQSLISGDDERALSDTRDDSTGIEFRWTPRNVTATAGAEQRFYKFADLEIDTTTFRQSLSYRFLPNARLVATASENFIDSGDSRTDLLNASLSLSWLPRRNLSIMPGLEAWSRDDQPSAGERTKEQFLRGSLEINWNLFKVDVNLRFTHDQRRGTITPRDEDRLIVTVIRRSR